VPPASRAGLTRARRDAAGSRLVSCFAIAFLLGSPALAQITIVVPEPAGRFKLGSVYLTPTLAVRNLGWDNNVFNSGSGGFRDTHAIVAPGLRFVWPPNERLKVWGNGGLNIAYFGRATSERYVEIFGSGNFQLEGRRLVLFGGGGGGRYRGRFSIEIDERLRRNDVHAHLGVRLKLSRRTHIELVPRFREVRHDEAQSVDGDDVKAGLDRDQRSLELGLRHALTRKTTLLLQVERREDVFPSEPTQRDKAESRRVMAGFSFSPKALIAGNVVAGIEDYPARIDQAITPYRGMVFAIGASVPISRAARLRFHVDRELHYAVARSQTVGELRNAFVRLSYGFTLSAAIGFDLVSRSRFDIERADYLLPFTTPTGPADRLDRRLILGQALLWPVHDKLLIGVNATWSKRTSNVAANQYQGLRLGLALELGR